MGVTRGKALPPDVTREVVTKTDGVPLFVEEGPPVATRQFLAVEDVQCSVVIYK